MKRTEIPAVKCYGHANKEEGLCSVIWRKDDDYIPCILRTAAADKLILDVVRAAITVKEADNCEPDVNWYPAIKLLGDAVQHLEKAGVKL